MRSSSRSSTYRLERAQDTRPVLVKVYENDPSSAAREFDTLQRFGAGSTVRALALEHRGDQTLLVVEDCGGQPLTTVLRESTLRLEDSLLIAIRLALALASVHRQGYVHCALTGASVLVELDTKTVKLDDFHACVPATELPAAERPVAARHASELSHLAPEQSGRIAARVDHRSDLYSLGVILFELFTGRLPFECATPAEFVHCHLAVTPPRPEQLAPELPPALCRLIEKLLAKSAADRYQSAFGVAADLERCLAQRHSGLDSSDFVLGRHDTSPALRLPSQLYGRIEQAAQLWRAYIDAREGPSSLVLVIGAEGVGKTALADQFRRAVIDAGGTLIRGKFDALTHTVPFAVFAEALEQLMARLLGEGDEQLATRRETLLEVLGPNAQLMVELVRGLEQVMGPQPPAPEVGPSERATRFNRLFADFVGVFCQPGSPLVLFLDDLQWADAASLELLEQLLERTRGHLLVVGSCRAEQLEGVGRVNATCAALSAAGVPVSRVELGPLARAQVAELLADMLACSTAEVAALAEIVTRKTGGVPLHIEQFLLGINQSDALGLEPDTQRWRWDLDQIEAADATQNVVDLVLDRLSPELREVLVRASCIGTEFSLAQLEALSSVGAEVLLPSLQLACQAQLLVRVISSDASMIFAFDHDGVQHGAYRRLEPEARARLHLQLARATTVDRELSLFELAEHLDAGLDLLLREDRGPRLDAALINRDAAAQASAQAAFAAALRYLDSAARLLPDDAWDREHELAFGVSLARLEALRACAETDRLRELLPEVLARAETVEERAAVLSIQYWLEHGEGKFEESLELELELIATLGLELPREPDEIAARCREDRPRVDAVAASAWLELPPTTDAEPLARALSNSASSALNLGEKQRFELLVVEGLILSLERGRSSQTALSLAYYAMLQLPRDDAGRDRAIALGRVASELAAAKPVARVHVEFSNSVFVYCWDRSMAEVLASMRRVRQLAYDLGDQVWASFSLWLIALLDGLVGAPLPSYLQRCEALLEAAQDGKSPFIASLLQLTIGFAEALEAVDSSVGLRRLDSFRDGPFAEEFIHCSYAGLARRVVLYLRGDYAGAWQLSCAHAPAFSAAFAGSFHVIHATFFHALAAAAIAPSLDAEARADAIEQLDAAVETMKSWAEWVPENFRAMYLLALAERRALERRGLDGLDDYDAAIAAARDDAAYLGALANERAARYLQGRGRGPLSWAYLTAARRDYARWGAHGKAAALAAELTNLQAAQLEDSPSARSHASAQSLDIIAVMESARAISGELDMTRLLATTLDIIVKNAGAERGLLLLANDGQLSVSASYGVTTKVAERDGADREYAGQIVAWVERTGRTMVLADAAESEQFSADPYIRQQRPKSLLCAPLRSKRGDALGVLYLENNLQPAVFSERQLEVLGLLLAQSSISIENARLFRQNAQVEADLRTAYEIIAESPIIVISWSYAPPSPVLFVSDNIERVLGYAPTDLLRWTSYAQLLHPEDRSRVQASIDAAAADPSVTQLRQEPYRIVSATGATRWLEAVLSFQRDASGRVLTCRGIVEDITDKHELAQRLLHAQKMDALGLLAGGVAHDFNNLLTVMMVNAEFLLEGLPANSEHRRQVENIISASTRAAGVTRQLLSFSRKAQIEPRIVRVGELVRQMLHLLDRVIGEHIEIELDIPDDLGHVEIDPPQLEQIVLNLVVNARDAMPRGGTLRIEAANVDADPSGAGDARVRLSVSDTGSGMSEAVRAQIFEPFFTTKPAGQGTGLGLATVLGIVRQYEGTIDVASDVGVGTRFDVTFSRVDPSAGEAVEPRQRLARGCGEVVLVVEDESPVRTVVCSFLDRHGYRALSCETLREAVELVDVHGERIDLLLTDVVLREGSGPEVAEAILARQPMVPVLFMSGYTDETLIGYGALRPENHLLTKPFGPEQLMRKIRELLDAPTSPLS